MTAPGYLVEGLGNPKSLNSASHGAGRLLSRADAKSSFRKAEMRKNLVDAGVQLMGGSMDESPMAYKDIDQVMNLQKELVQVLGVFKPKFVRMES
ncbi:RNA-splicing ligase RtcB [compost metagenome]